MRDFSDIPALKRCVKFDTIEKGWSRDEKYHIVSADKQEFLLHLSDKSSFADKKAEFEQMKLLFSHDIPLPEALELGFCADGEKVYGLFRWLPGNSVDELFSSLSSNAQYQLGVQAGQILRKIHEIPAPSDILSWREHWENKWQRWILRYQKSSVQYPQGALALDYVAQHLDLLDDVMQTFQHDDFHSGNLILQPDGKLALIDFERWDYGDPYEEFVKNFWFNREHSIPFAKGQFDGYFDGQVPAEFWARIKLYLARECIVSVTWAQDFSNAEVLAMRKRIENILADFDYFTSETPSWYD